MLRGWEYEGSMKQTLTIGNLPDLYIFLSFLLLFCGIEISTVQATESSADRLTFAEAAKYTVKLKARARYPFYDDEIGSIRGAGFLIDKDRRSKNTKQELSARSLVHRMGYRYRLHRSNLPGKPDHLFPIKGKVIFVHGCFWHYHGCKRGRMPKSKLV